MKTTINGYNIEGTPSEIKELLNEIEKEIEHRFTKEDIYNAIKNKEKQLLIPRNLTVTKISKHKKRYPARCKRWTRRDDSILKNAYNNSRKKGFIKKLMKELGRTRTSIYRRASTLGITDDRFREKFNKEKHQGNT